jgi:PIN domain nuclease of toxin-antitoxin system
LQAAALPMHHRDPFDRMLVAQAQLERMALVSADEVFQKYEGPVVVWAGK